MHATDLVLLAAGAAFALALALAEADAARPAKPPSPTRAKLFGMRGYPADADAWDESRPFFPFLDTFGQYLHRQWPGKTRSPADLAAHRAAEEKDLAAHPGPKNWDAWGGWADGPKLKATGFFRAEKVKDKWWLVDPDGRLFFSHGIDCVNTNAATPIDDRQTWFQDFPGEGPEFRAFFSAAGRVIRDYYAGKQPRCFNFAEANLRRKYGPAWRDTFAALAHRRLRSWGLNTIGNWSDMRIARLRQTPYVATVHFSSPPIEGSTGYWGKFKDPFDPAFEAAVRQAMGREAGSSAGDPWCVGYFVDNELSWGDETALALAALQSPPGQPAKKAFLDDLKGRYGTVAKLNAAWGTSYAAWDALASDRSGPDKKRAAGDLAAFTGRIAEQYFATVCRAVKDVAPDQLYLGCRFAWANDRAAAAAVKSCDVVSYNRYERSVGGLKLPGEADRPVIIGEFHFGALDRGLFHTGLVPCKDQAERAAAYKAYVRSAVANPLIVGCHWFQYLDQPLIGRPLDGENYQIGFLDVCDTPYPETIAACREMGYGLYTPAR